MAHDNLANFYRVNFSMAQHHKWSVAELEGMYPYERAIYAQLLRNHLEELKAKIESQRSF